MQRWGLLQSNWAPRASGMLENRERAPGCRWRAVAVDGLPMFAAGKARLEWTGSNAPSTAAGVGSAGRRRTAS